MCDIGEDQLHMLELFWGWAGLEVVVKGEGGGAVHCHISHDTQSSTYVARR